MGKKLLGVSLLVLGSFIAAVLFITPIRSQVQQIAGLAVAQTETRWNNLMDAAIGDNLTKGIGAFSPYLFDGTNFDPARGDVTYGLDVDVIRLGGMTESALYDDTENPTTLSFGSYLMLFDGINWDMALTSVHEDNLTTPHGQNVASFNYHFNGTGWDRQLSSIHGDNLTTAYGQNTASFNYHFDGTNWDRQLSSTHGDNLITTSGQNVASFGYVFDGTNWDRKLSSIHGDNLTTAYGQNTAAFGYVFDGTNWDRARSNLSPAPPGNLVIGNSYTVNTVLLSSAARTTSGSSGALTGYGNFKSGVIQVNVTAQSGTAPTLDVYIDTTTDETNWINIAHFTQFGAATGRRAIQISENTAGGTADFDATTDLAAGTVRQGPWGSTLRVRWVIGGTSPSYTFSVTGAFKS